MKEFKPVTICIYFIACENFVKIGITGDLEKRLIGIQTSNPFPLSVLYTMPGDDFTEEFLHYKFNEHRHRGEWFHKHQDILDFIDDHKNDPETAFWKKPVHGIVST